MGFPDGLQALQNGSDIDLGSDEAVEGFARPLLRTGGGSSLTVSCAAGGHGGASFGELLRFLAIRFPLPRCPIYESRLNRTLGTGGDRSRGAEPLARRCALADTTGELPVPRLKARGSRPSSACWSWAKKHGKFLQVCRVLGDNCDSFYRLRDLSVRGSAQAVAAIRQEYELYLAVENIDHS